MSKRRIAAILIPVLVLALAGALWWGYRLRSMAGRDVLVLYGNVDIREARPAFDDTGPVAALLVTEGARVHKGELIARIDDARYALRATEARQTALRLGADLERLVHGSRPQEVDRAKAAMAALDAVYKNDELLYQRTVRLVPVGVASTEDRDNAAAAVRAARASYEAARQSFELAKIGPRAEDVAAARHAFRAAAAAAALAARELADTRLYAPVDGIVEDRILEVGDMAAPNVPVYTIALRDPLWVRAYVPEGDLGRVRLGMAATVATDSFPGKSYRGWVGYLSPTSEFTPKTVETPELRTALVYQVRIYVCDARGELRLGMPATVSLDFNGKAGAPRPGCGPDDAGGR